MDQFPKTWFILLISLVSCHLWGGSECFLAAEQRLQLLTINPAGSKIRWTDRQTDSRSGRSASTWPDRSQRLFQIWWLEVTDGGEEGDGQGRSTVPLQRIIPGDVGPTVIQHSVNNDDRCLKQAPDSSVFFSGSTRPVCPAPDQRWLQVD